VPFSASEATSVFEALARQVIEPSRRYLARRTDPATAADVLSEALLVLWRRLEDVPLQAPLLRAAPEGRRPGDDVPGRTSARRPSASSAPWGPGSPRSGAVGCPPR